MSFRPGRLLGVLMLVGTFATSAAAQVTDPQTPVPQPTPQPTPTSYPPFMGGLKIGANYSTLEVESDSLEIKPLFGLNGGLFASYRMSPNFGVQIEALLSQRGTQDDIEEADAHARLTYVDIPLTIGLGTSRASGPRFYLFTGPQLGVKLKAEVINDQLDESTGIEDQVKSWDFGWTLGAAVEVQRASIDARYTHGLSDINAAGGSWVKNRTFTVLLGFRLR